MLHVKIRMYNIKKHINMNIAKFIILLKKPKEKKEYIYQDTRSCIVQPSSGVQDTVCYLHKPTLSRFQPFITQTTKPILIIML